MAYAQRKRVCAVFAAGSGVEVEDYLHHLLHLHFFSPPVAGQRHFQCGRVVFKDRDAILSGKKQDDPARGPERQRGADAFMIKDLFNA